MYPLLDFSICLSNPTVNKKAYAQTYNVVDTGITKGPTANMMWLQFQLKVSFTLFQFISGKNVWLK
jgi:hypothetical protein